MVRVIVVGGGMAGCAAAIAAAKAGAQAVLLERTDMLLASGLRAGRMDFEGKLVTAEETKTLGCGEMFEALESILLHRGNLFGERHGYVYNCALVEPTIRAVVEKAGVDLRMESRAVDVKKDDGRLRAVVLADKEVIEGDAFVDCTGSSGGVPICTKYGKGCVMCCTFRCTIFGDRVSIATKAGAPELMRRRPDGTPGAIGAAIGVPRESLSSELQAQLKEKGAVMVPLPKELIDYNKLAIMGAVRLKEQVENLCLVDIGINIKLVAAVYFPLRDLRKVPGMERAEIEEPLGGAVFNKIGGVSIAPTEDSLRVPGFVNLFCGGVKSLNMDGLAECIATGSLAGHNAVRAAVGEEPLVLPRTTGVGDFIAYVHERTRTPEGLQKGNAMGSGHYLEHMIQIGLYTSDRKEARERIEQEGLKGVYAKKRT